MFRIPSKLLLIFSVWLALTLSVRAQVLDNQMRAVKDALRLWRLKSNQDRRHMDGLSDLSAIMAAEPLREMYTQMKKKDPFSFVPDRALRLLQ